MRCNEGHRSTNISVAIARLLASYVATLGGSSNRLAASTTNLPYPEIILRSAKASAQVRTRRHASTKNTSAQISAETKALTWRRTHRPVVELGR